MALFLACFALTIGIAAVAYAAITRRAGDTRRRT